MASKEERRERMIARRYEKKQAAAAAAAAKSATQQAKPSVPSPKLKAGPSTTHLYDELGLLTPEGEMYTISDVTFSEAAGCDIVSAADMFSWASESDSRSSAFRRTERPVGSKNAAGGSTKTHVDVSKTKTVAKKAKKAKTHKELLEAHLKEVEALMAEQPRV